MNFSGSNRIQFQKVIGPDAGKGRWRFQKCGHDFFILEFVAVFTVVFFRPKSADPRRIPLEPPACQILELDQ